MARFMRARSVVVVVALGAGSVSGATLLATSSAQAVGLHAQVRVDQVGYLPTDVKHA